jgi:DHA1 family bicyclomycin/chloramphenicol resistance-like MFS transporter
MLRPGTFPLTLLLGLLTGIGPLSVDMYLASLPDMSRLLGAPASQIQLTISFYLFGFAIAQVFHGPLSDRRGRKPVLLAALGIYLIATLACALAASIEALIAARFVQAVGASGAIVLARAVVRDMFDGAQIGRELSRMASIMALAPLVAPLAGGLLHTAFGWRSNFVVLFAIGLMAAAMVWLLLPETLRLRAPEPVSVMSILRSYRRFLAERTFVAYLGIAIFCMAGLFAWISTAAFILQDIYGLTPMAFGITFTIASSGYLVGTLIGSRLVMRRGSAPTMTLGAFAMAAGGLAAPLFVVSGAHQVYGLVAAVALYLAGMGLVWPNAQAGALLPFPDRAGAASSLLGFLTQTISALVGAVLGHVLTTTAWPFAIASALAGCGVLALCLMTVRLRAAGAAGT